MNIQIYGKSKCFDTRKAERWFKERRIKYQYVDLPRYGLGRRELESVRTAVGAENLLDETAKGAELVRYLARPEDRLEKLLEHYTNYSEILSETMSAMKHAKPVPLYKRRRENAGIHKGAV